MKRRRILLLLALVAVAAGLVLFWPRGPKEPVVEGKRLMVWLSERTWQNYIFTDESTLKALKATSTNAVPYLLHEFTRPRSKWRATWNRWASAVPVVNLQMEDDERRISLAARGLYVLGPEAAPAVPTLARYIGDTGRGGLAAAILGKVGAPALPWLLNATASTNPFVAQGAMNGLVWMTQESESAIHAMVQLLRHTNSSVRMITAVNLRRVTTRLDLTVPALAAALADPEEDVQSLAARSLGEMGSNAQPALPALLRLMTSTNSPVASSASNAVFHIDRASLPPRGP